MHQRHGSGVGKAVVAFAWDIRGLDDRLYSRIK